MAPCANRASGFDRIQAIAKPFLKPDKTRLSSEPAEKQPQ
jgi:hypothetical protein